GAEYTGVDLTEAAIELAQQRFVLFGLPGQFRTADAESLDFAHDSFYLVSSHGVLHHTPDTARAIQEVHRVLRPGGRAVVMLYHRNSYNYRVKLRILRRIGVRLVRCHAGLQRVHRLTGEPIESLQEHARKFRERKSGYLGSQEF